MKPNVKENDKQSLDPKWAEDFPVDSVKDIEIARRDFIRFLFLISLGLFTGSFWVYIKQFFQRVALHPYRILGREDIEVGGSYVFQLPNGKGPAILLRPSANEYFAYSQKCTHLQCPVIWKKGEGKLLCPCHHGAFDAKTGDVLYGPPERPLPKIHLDHRPDGIYFKSAEIIQ